MMLLKCIMIVASTVLGGAAGAELGQTLGIMNHAATGAPGFGGSKMERTFTKYVDLPVGEAALSAAGWTKNSICDPVIGHMWTQEGSAATKSKPLVLYTTKAGQMSGVGVHIYGKLPEPQQPWITASTTAGANGYRVDVAFRKGSIICSGEKSDALIGDALTVNPGANGGESKELSLTQTGAEAAGWHRGSCFDGMGFHSFLDTSVGANKMSWNAENLFPVVAMYHEGQVNAIFFASWTVQQGVFSSHQWEPVPLLNAAMCKNTCDSDCTFAGTSAWSTLHVYFRDHNLVKCDSSLSCSLPHMACCPKSNVIV